MKKPLIFLFILITACAGLQNFVKPALENQYQIDSYMIWVSTTHPDLVDKIYNISSTAEELLVKGVPITTVDQRVVADIMGLDIHRDKKLPLIMGYQLLKNIMAEKAKGFTSIQIEGQWLDAVRSINRSANGYRKKSTEEYQ